MNKTHSNKWPNTTSPEMTGTMVKSARANIGYFLYQYDPVIILKENSYKSLK